MVLVTRQAHLAVLLVTAVVALISAIAIAKHHTMNMTLHVYDIVFYLASWPTILFLWYHFRLHFLAFVTAVSTIMITSLVIFRLDPTRVRRRWSLCAALILGFVALRLRACQYRSALLGILSRQSQPHFVLSILSRCSSPSVARIYL
jgi:hypothetical protein